MNDQITRELAEALRSAMIAANGVKVLTEVEPVVGDFCFSFQFGDRKFNVSVMDSGPAPLIM